MQGRAGPACCPGQQQWQTLQQRPGRAHLHAQPGLLGHLGHRPAALLAARLPLLLFATLRRSAPLLLLLLALLLALLPPPGPGAALQPALVCLLHQLQRPAMLVAQRL